MIFPVSCDSPLYIRSHSKAVLNRAIEQDTKFLADNSVMDYSLLVGLEPGSDELVLGIIGTRVTHFVQCSSIEFERIIIFIASRTFTVVFRICRLHKNIHLGQEAGNHGEEVRDIGRPG